MNQSAIPSWALQMHSPLDSKLGFEMHELSADKVVGSIPVEGNTQPFGLLHGGANALLVETLGSMGAVAHGYPTMGAVGVDMNVTHVRPARSGRVTGTATALHLGKRLAIYQVEIRNDEEQLICTGRITCQLVPMQDSNQ